MLLIRTIYAGMHTQELITLSKAIDIQMESAAEEIKALQAYPDEELIAIIKEVGFKCDFCARCCTQEFNDHVFLLDEDLESVREADPDAVEPAPYYELCDQHGNFYVSGYALKTQKDGSCIFLRDKRCTIYDRRPFICRLYPYMLHMEADEKGNIGWRQISGLDLHGCYHDDISDEECKKLAREIKNYEQAFLEQKLSFLEKARQHFEKNKLKYVQSVYDREMRKFNKGGQIKVFVFFNGVFEDNSVGNNTSL